MNNNCNQDTYKNNQHPDKYYYDYYYRNYGTNNIIELYGPGPVHKTLPGSYPLS